MPKLSIDGQDLEVPRGTNLIEACRQLDVDVPHYCYHPALSVVASCRMCRTEAADDMVIRTDGDDCKRARQATLEFLLANHPLDCPICDKAGECDLQNFSYLHGNPVGRFTEPKRDALKNTPIGNHILLDQERCILCTRCTRFMDEYAKAPQLVVAGRGDRNVITTFPGQPMDSDYEGNLADLCPVGALTLKEFRFKSRVWDLKHHDSVCPLCDRGCSIQLETKRNQLLRVRPRPNEQVNGHFLCDRGRFQLLKVCNPEQRQADALLGDQVGPTDELLPRILQAMQARAGSWVVVLSPRMTNEEVLLAQQACAPLLRDGGLVFAKALEIDGDDILFTGRLGANQAGLQALGISGLEDAELRSLLAEEDSRAALFFDLAVAERVAAREAIDFLAVLDLWQVSEAPPLQADLAIPGQLFSEKTGTWLNGTHILQRLRPAQRSPQGTLTERQVLRQLAESQGMSPTEGDKLTAAFLEALGQAPRSLQQIPAIGISLELSGKVPVA
jgi:NADH-quinone oxidoreductase subunit G